MLGAEQRSGMSMHGVRRETIVTLLAVAFLVLLLLVAVNLCEEGNRSFELEFISDRIARCKGPGLTRTVVLSSGVVEQAVGYVAIPWLLVALFPVVILVWDQALLNLLTWNEDKTGVAVSMPWLVLSALLETWAVSSFLLLVYWNTNDSEQSDQHFGATTMLFVSFLLQTVVLLWEMRMATSRMDAPVARDPCCTSASEIRHSITSIAYVLLPTYVVCLFLFALSRAAIFEYIIVFSWALVLAMQELVWHAIRGMQPKQLELGEWGWAFVTDWAALLLAAVLIAVPLTAETGALQVLGIICGVAGVALYPVLKVRRQSVGVVDI